MSKRLIMVLLFKMSEYSSATYPNMQFICYFFFALNEFTKLPWLGRARNIPVKSYSKRQIFSCSKKCKKVALQNDCSKINQLFLRKHFIIFFIIDLISFLAYSTRRDPKFHLQLLNIHFHLETPCPVSPSNLC